MNKKIKIILSVIGAVCLVTAAVFLGINLGKKDKPSIVCLGYAQYDWTLQVLDAHEKDFDVKYLLDSGVDLHSYQPSPADILAIKTADLFIYTGGESEEWVEDILIDVNVNSISLLECIENPYEEEIIDGMEDEEEENEEEEEEEEETEYDEHVWLSLQNAKVLVRIIADEICKLDKDNAADYDANADAYIEKLDGLDQQYQTVIENANRDTILFADRFPFRYLVEDYNLNYYAAFVGCSAETEASPATIAFLIEKVNELDLQCIVVLENTRCTFAEIIIRDSADKNQDVLTMNSLQSISKSNIINGISYLSVMESNLETLTQALT
ncbi:MAG: metal ABC transporter substrate-binding protein [Christensenellaceae bacterium]|jgi:zinc transport system substrate-binding protein|nr:metal ABC transporter substrate-binding protein [Christensenellaceae bacterium]